MEINQEEREIIDFLLGASYYNELKDFLFRNLDKNIILKKMKYVLKKSLYFCDWDDSGTYKNFYKCKYCGLGQHKEDTRLLFSDSDFRIQRRCLNKKYFKHEIDCPVLIAKDFLTKMK